jgi:hypothetical protein
MDWNRIDYVRLAEDDTKLKEFWVTTFEENPQLLYDLLYDIVATKQGTIGKGRRRKMNGNLDDVWRCVYGGDNS